MQERWVTVQPFQKRHALNHLTKHRQSESMNPSNSVFHSINDLCCHARTWGDPGNPQLFLLHSWMDVLASFQFRLDVLQEIWRFIAPDWRRLVRTSGWRILSSFDFARV
jgi:hypothetical protein